MMLALDHQIFGDGFGMRSPSLDNKFYWLVDTSGEGPAPRRGRLYTFFPGLGAQLTSFEWLTPTPGTRRRLAGRDFVVLHARRRWLRVEVSWAMVGLPSELEEANAEIRALKADLGEPSL